MSEELVNAKQPQKKNLRVRFSCGSSKSPEEQEEPEDLAPKKRCNDAEVGLVEVERQGRSQEKQEDALRGFGCKKKREGLAKDFDDLKAPPAGVSSSGGSVTPSGNPWQREQWLEALSRAQSKTDCATTSGRTATILCSRAPAKDEVQRAAKVRKVPEAPMKPWRTSSLVSPTRWISKATSAAAPAWKTSSLPIIRRCPSPQASRAFKTLFPPFSYQRLGQLPAVVFRKPLQPPAAGDATHPSPKVPAGAKRLYQFSQREANLTPNALVGNKPVETVSGSATTPSRVSPLAPAVLASQAQPRCAQEDALRAPSGGGGELPRFHARMANLIKVLDPQHTTPASEASAQETTSTENASPPKKRKAATPELGEENDSQPLKLRRVENYHIEESPSIRDNNVTRETFFYGDGGEERPWWPPSGGRYPSVKHLCLRKSKRRPNSSSTSR